MASHLKSTASLLILTLSAASFALPDAALAAPKKVTASCIPLSNVCIPSGVTDVMKVLGGEGNPESAVTPASEFKPLEEGFCDLPTGDSSPHVGGASYHITLPKKATGFTDQESDQVHGFNFSNGQASEVFTDPDGSPSQVKRDWLFSFKGRGSEMGLVVIDYRINELADAATGKTIEVDNTNSNPAIQYDFFPRRNLPAIRSEGTGSERRLIVTLSTGEEVTYEAETWKVLSGVLKEVPTTLKPVVQSKQQLLKDLSSTDQRRLRLVRILGTRPNYSLISKKHPASTEIQYTGTGVYITQEVLSINEARAPGHMVQIKKGRPDAKCLSEAKTAAAKAECATCTLESSLVWNRTSAGCYKSQFSTDEAFDQFLSTHCKFRLF
ncbi:MAG: hypothetical protein H7222_03125 [Methylotenera sp.]|nr:hypothetical protein [Oligoflexia bacterium]